MQLCFLHCWRYINDLCLTFLPMTWEKQKKQNKNTFRHLRRLNFIFFPNPPHLLWYEKIAGKNNEIVGRKKIRFFDNTLVYSPIFQNPTHLLRGKKNGREDHDEIEREILANWHFCYQHFFVNNNGQSHNMHLRKWCSLIVSYLIILQSFDLGESEEDWW